MSYYLFNTVPSRFPSRVITLTCVGYSIPPWSGKLAKIYQIVDIPYPTYRTEATPMNFVLTLTISSGKQRYSITPRVRRTGEASWSLTASLDVKMGVFLRNLESSWL